LTTRTAPVPVNAGGRPAVTYFRPLIDPAASSGGKPNSVVACRLASGRTHQIRVHLQSIGCPIANDARYAITESMWKEPKGDSATGKPELGQSNRRWTGIAIAMRDAGASLPGVDAAAVADLECDAWRQHNPLYLSRPVDPFRPSIVLQAYESKDPAPASASTASSSSSLLELQDLVAAANAAGVPALPKDDEEASFAESYAVATGNTDIREPGHGSDPITWAQLKLASTYVQKGAHIEFSPAQMHSMGLWLHSTRYHGPGFCFEVPLPSWASCDEDLEATNA